MQLLYTWIMNNGVINNQGFNFGGEFRFDYNSKTKTLTVKKNPNYIDDFFYNYNGESNGNASVVNVTAIVGENGSGKSTLLNFIKGNLANGAEMARDYAIFIIVDNDGNKVIYAHIIIEIEHGNYKDYGFSINYFGFPDDLLGNISSNNEETRDTSIIYFSNVFDNNLEDISTGEIHDISTNFLIKEDKLIFERDNNSKYGLSEIEAHRLAEINRQIMFINDFMNTDSIPCHLPEEVRITPIPRVVNKISLQGVSDYGKFHTFVRYINEQIDEYFNERHSHDGTFPNGVRARCHFYKAVFNNFYYEINNYVSSVSKGVILSVRKYSNKDILKGEDIFEKIIYLFDVLSRTVSWGRSIIDTIELFEEVLNSWIIDPEDEITFRIPVDIGNRFNLSQLLRVYKNSFLFNQYLLFDWKGLSSGEKAVLSMYARFYSKSDYQLIRKERMRENLIILIDEGELYFHPQWQKNFLNNFLKFIPVAYLNENLSRKIQVILTSNSPFIASDLPSSNVIFLEKKERASTVIDGLEDRKQTFAANIHTLFSNSFFMKDGLIGTFAKQKINSLIDQIMHSDISILQRDQNKIQKLVNIIGEPVIKNKLLSMLQDRLAVDLLSVHEKIAILQRQIDDLRSQQRND